DQETHVVLLAVESTLANVGMRVQALVHVRVRGTVKDRARRAKKPTEASVATPTSGSTVTADHDAGFAGTAGVHMIETAVSHHERRSEARGNDDKVEVVVDVSRPGIFQDYSFLPGVFDELFAPGMTPRDDFAEALAPLTGLTPAELRRRNEQAAAAFLLQGVTFSVYSNAQGSERIFPFCLIPRLISAADWDRVERGLAQRIRALEAFLGDIYGERRILSAPRIPAELIVESKQYLRPMIGITPPGGVRIHLAGIDLIRDGRGTFRVLEDNLRCPSGVSYV